VSGAIAVNLQPVGRVGIASPGIGERAALLIGEECPGSTAAVHRFGKAGGELADWSRASPVEHWSQCIRGRNSQKDQDAKQLITDL